MTTNLLVYPKQLDDESGSVIVWTACLMSKHIIAQASSAESAVNNLVEWVDTVVALAERDQRVPLAEHQDTPAELLKRFEAGRLWDGSAPEDVVVRLG